MSRRRGYKVVTNNEQTARNNYQNTLNTNCNGNGTSKDNKTFSHASQSRPIFPSTAKIYHYSKNDYKKGQKAFPPPESLYIAKDTQVDPCFLRTTTMALNTLPRKTSIPIAVWVTPFASDRVNVVQVRAPLRCSACKAYVNPYFQFDGTRRAASCNLCGIRFPIDQNVDKMNLQSAEIATQSIIDFRVSEKIYFKKRTDIVKIIAVVELSMNTLELNIFSTILSSLKSVFQSHQYQQTIRISIVFYYDNGVGFLQKSQNNQKPTVFLVPNNKVNMNCCPLSEEEMFFDPNKQQEQLISCLQFLENYGNSYWKQGKFSHNANYIHAIKCIKECFEQQTGKILLFSCLDPRWGTCALKSRSEQQQKLPLKPTNMDVYQLGKELTKARIGVQHFYFSKDSLVNHELATTHFLSSITGGQLHLYNTFSNQSVNVLYYQIFHSLTRTTFYDVDFTCRTSPGLNVVRYGVPEGLRQARDVALSTVNSTSSFLIECQQQEKLDQSKGAFLQFALLYTNCKNQRRIRVINFKFDVTSRLETFYDSIDYLSLSNAIARSYSQRLLKADNIKVRQEALVWLASLISEFQNKCQQALSVRIGGILVPQGMGWALYYLNSIFSSQLFLKNHRQSDDLRVQQYLRLQSDSPYFFASHHYPRLYPLTLDIYDQEPLPGDFLQTDNEDDQKIAILPRTLPLTRESVRQDGVYLYDGCEQLVILVQPQAGEELLNDLFGTTDWEQIQSQGLPQLQTAHNIRVNNIVTEIRRRNTQNGGMYQVLKVKTPMKKKRYSDLMASILKEDSFDSKFPQFMQLLRGAIPK